MKTVLIAPRKYVQGRGVLGEAGSLISELGTKPLVLWDATVKGILGESLLANLREAGLEPIDVDFQGESTRAEVDRVAQIANHQGADVSVGVGGGKTLDTAKGAAAAANLKMVTVPTIASTDTPCSSATVWYSPQGDCLGWDCWGRNPDLVLVDSQVIANGPVRAFVAGMGDALSTWVEAEAAYKTRATNLGGGVATQVAMHVARLCFESLVEYGIEAKRAVERHVVIPAVEKIVEANVLMSGLGFESGGLATAHMIGNLLTSLPECKGLLHGEKVAFGVVSQLMLDDEQDFDEIEVIVDFLIAVGLPVTFEDLNLKGVGREGLQMIGDACAGEGSLCANHPFEVTAEQVIDAMIAADALGHRRLEHP